MKLSSWHDPSLCVDFKMLKDTMALILHTMWNEATTPTHFGAIHSIFIFDIWNFPFLTWLTVSFGTEAQYFIFIASKYLEVRSSWISERELYAI